MTERTNLTPEEREARLLEWQKDTSPHEVALHDLETEEQRYHAIQIFVHKLMMGSNQTEAYRAAYPNTQANENSLRTMASALFRNKEVAQLYQQAHEQRLRFLAVNTMYVVAETLEQYKKADADGDRKNALRALEHLSKYTGGFDKNVGEKTGPVQINVVYQGRPEALPSVQVIETLDGICAASG